MSLETDDLVALLDDLFAALDAVELAPRSIINSDTHKEHYETLAMFAFRKLQAAQYHRQRVNDLIAARDAALSGRSEQAEGSELKGSYEITTAISYSAVEFSYELCAFLAAIRSGIDFLAQLCGEHTKAIQVDSITTFIRLIHRGNTGPTLDVIKSHAGWIAEAREYRDYIVHRMCLLTVTGGQVKYRDGISVTSQYPVVVPDNTPKHMPDTRKARYLDLPETRFVTQTSEAEATDIDGNKRLLGRKIEIFPARGYMRIEDLMDRELVAFKGFFRAILHALISLNFQAAPIQKTKSET
jgi:hypothetical protein